jgi:uncharacterized protein
MMSLFDAIDSHVHLDNIRSAHPDRIEWFKTRGIVPISWSFADRIDSKTDLKIYLENKQKTIHACAENGLTCFFLAGIHPRNIPPDLNPDKISKMLLPFLEDPLCLGIGEIGLETADSREKDVLTAQLDMARAVTDRKKILGIHTPRNNKTRVTEEILSVLADYSAFCTHIVIDHCQVQTIAGVLSSGFWAGITLSPVKASEKDLKQIVGNHPDHLERLLVNTDSGTDFYEDLFRFSQSAEFSKNIKDKLLRENPRRFYNLPVHNSLTDLTIR